MKFDRQSYLLTDTGKTSTIFLIVGLVGLLASAAGWFLNSSQFFHSYLTAFVFWTSIALGGLFFVMLHHLVDATWSVVIRKFGESLMMALPFMALFAIPVLLGARELFHWTDPELVATDELLQGKSGYLNFTFFLIRTIIYFIVWTILAYLLNKVSMSQDNSYSPEQTRKMRVISAPGMILFAFSITFASFDWLMSLDAHWYSTIFGVYVFSGSFLAMLSLVMFVIIRLQSNNVLTDYITKEHYHDLGKLMFAFTVFWGYMAFSQYFLIWYGNIPEETIWFLHRWGDGWEIISLTIVFGHFVVPFFVLFPQNTKRNKTVMTIMAIWLLLMHWVDIYWIVMPSHHHGLHLSWIDPAAFIGIGGIFMYLFWKKFVSQPLVPVNDPKLQQSIDLVS